MLNAAGFSVGTAGADGRWGPATDGAVKAFQREYGLQIESICGNRMWNKLDEVTSNKPVEPPKPPPVEPPVEPTIPADLELCSPWAVDSIREVMHDGIMQGVGGGRFNPKGTITREEIAVLIVRMKRIYGLELDSED
jgi:peptidoglycan hydrolase-like protein with peptidoglycan-binding domain